MDAVVNSTGIRDGFALLAQALAPNYQGMIQSDLARYERDNTAARTALTNAQTAGTVADNAALAAAREAILSGDPSRISAIFAGAMGDGAQMNAAPGFATGWRTSVDPNFPTDPNFSRILTGTGVQSYQNTPDGLAATLAARPTGASAPPDVNLLDVQRGSETLAGILQSRFGVEPPPDVVLQVLDEATRRYRAGPTAGNAAAAMQEALSALDISFSDPWNGPPQWSVTPRLPAAAPAAPAAANDGNGGLLDFLFATGEPGAADVTFDFPSSPLARMLGLGPSPAPAQGSAGAPPAGSPAPAAPSVPAGATGGGAAASGGGASADAYNANNLPVGHTVRLQNGEVWRVSPAPDGSGNTWVRAE